VRTTFCYLTGFVVVHDICRDALIEPLENGAVSQLTLHVFSGKRRQAAETNRKNTGQLAVGLVPVAREKSLLGHVFTSGTALWIGGIVLWIVFVSVFFTTVISGENKPTIDEGITGASLVPVVATEGISVLGCTKVMRVSE
jgi:hypothetical protein